MVKEQDGQKDDVRLNNDDWIDAGKYKVKSPGM